VSLEDEFKLKPIPKARYYRGSKKFIEKLHAGLTKYNRRRNAERKKQIRYLRRQEKLEQKIKLRERIWEEVNKYKVDIRKIWRSTKSQKEDSNGNS
jgi:uncharacterized protein (DUF2252 family)